MSDKQRFFIPDFDALNTPTRDVNGSDTPLAEAAAFAGEAFESADPPLSWMPPNDDPRPNADNIWPLAVWYGPTPAEPIAFHGYEGDSFTLSVYLPVIHDGASGEEEAILCFVPAYPLGVLGDSHGGSNLAEHEASVYTIYLVEQANALLGEMIEWFDERTAPDVDFSTAETFNAYFADLLAAVDVMLAAFEKVKKWKGRW